MFYQESSLNVLLVLFRSKKIDEGMENIQDMKTHP
jgi:hypothetical protein